MYKAKDGKVFETEKECRAHEFKREMVERIYNELRHSDSDEIYDWILENTKWFK
jgi:hypothetical protein